MKIMDRLMNEFLRECHSNGLPPSADEEELVRNLINEFEGL
jgi:hypothetical protein